MPLGTHHVFAFEFFKGRHEALMFMELLSCQKLQINVEILTRLLFLKTKDVLIFDTSSKQNTITNGMQDLEILNSKAIN